MCFACVSASTSTSERPQKAAKGFKPTRPPTSAAATKIVLKIVTERCQQNRWMNSKLSQRNKIASTEELNALAPLQDTWKRLNC